MSGPSKINILQRTADFAVAICALVIASCTLVIGYRGLSPLPLFDQWGHLDPRMCIEHLFDLHNEHRIALTKLLFAADTWLFGGRNLLEFFVTGSLFVSIAVIYWQAARFKEGLDKYQGLLVFGVMLCFTLNPLTVGSLLWAMHVQNSGVYFLAILAFWLIALSSSHRTKTGSLSLLLLAATTGVVATFTSANGLLVGIFLVIEGFALGIGLPAIAILITSALGAIMLFLHGNPATGSVLSAILSNPLEIGKFFLIFLGSIVRQATTVSDTPVAESLALVLGFLSIVFILVHLVVCVSHRRHRGPERFSVFSLVVSLFLLASAVLISVGRTRFGITQAYTEHYNLLRVLYWANLLISIVAVTEMKQMWNVLRMLGLASAVIFVLEIPIRADGMRYRDAALNQSAAALASDVYDPAPWHLINLWDESNLPVVAFMKQQVRYLRQNHLSIFHDQPAKWLGGPIEGLPGGATSCPGGILTAHNSSDDKGSYQVLDGWVRQTVRSDREPQIIVTGPFGNVIGFGAISADRSGAARWTGYARSAPAQLYFLDSGTFCRLVP
jgi:hypothetical protein